jgi:hypothetical protein
VFGTVFFGCWLLGGVFAGIGTQEFGAAIDGIGYGIVQPFTWVTGFYFAMLVCVVTTLTYAKFRGYFGYTVSFFLGIVAMFSTAYLGLMLTPLHFGRVCDTMDAMWACDAATFRVRDAC